MANTVAATPEQRKKCGPNTPPHRSKRNTRARSVFLEELRATGNVSASYRAAGLGKRTVYDWREVDPEFAAEWEEALEARVDAWEQEAERRAVFGDERPVFYQGKEVGKITEYSDRLLEFLLKGRRREVYGDKVENTLALSDPLQRLVDEIHQNRKSMRMIEHEE